MVPDDTKDVAHPFDVDLVLVGDLGDIERRRKQIERRDARRELGRNAERHVFGRSPARCGRVRIRRAHNGNDVISRATAGPKNSTVLPTASGRGRWRRSHRLPRSTSLRDSRYSAVCASTSQGRVECVDVLPEQLLAEDRARRLVGAHDVGAGRAGFLAEPERERRAGPVHHPVHERRSR